MLINYYQVIALRLNKIPKLDAPFEADSRYRLLVVLRELLNPSFSASSITEDVAFSSSSSRDAITEAPLSLGTLNEPAAFDSMRFASARMSSPATVTNQNTTYDYYSPTLLLPI